MSLQDAERRVIVNADDFGLSAGVNAGILAGHLQGVVTSATVMANGAAFDDAAARARAHPSLGVGCHLTLIGGPPTAPAAAVPGLIERNGRFPDTLGAFLRRLLAGRVRTAEVVVEFRAQAERVMQAGIRPTHFDSHKHTHAHPVVLEAALRVAEEFGVRCIRSPFERLTFGADRRARRFAADWRTLVKRKVAACVLARYARSFHRRAHGAPVIAPDFFFGFAHTGLLTPDFLCYLMENLPPGTSELMCHPAEVDAALRNSVTRLKEARFRELAALTDARVRRVVEAHNVRLIHFGVLAEEREANSRKP